METIQLEVYSYSLDLLYSYVIVNAKLPTSDTCYVVVEQKNVHGLLKYYLNGGHVDTFQLSCLRNRFG